MFEIRRYTADYKKLWDRYVLKARNATFLFFRDYMDYHKDRFTDHSLLFYKNGHLHSIMQDATFFHHRQCVADNSSFFNRRQ